MLKLENIKAGYSRNHNVLHGISLHIKKGETVAIIGQNGAGKSTLAKSVVNLLPYKKGTVIYNGQDISTLPTMKIINSGISYFMQGGQIFPHLTIKENIQFAGRNLSKKNFNLNFEYLRKFFTFAEEIDFNTEASYLSGGQKHQLALMMVLMTKPQFLILDEPSAGLSPVSTNKMYKILNNLREEMKITIMLIEQNVHKAIEFADRVVLLKAGLIDDIIDANETKLTIDIVNEKYFD